jgi:hypothetical protein
MGNALRSAAISGQSGKVHHSQWRDLEGKVTENLRRNQHVLAYIRWDKERKFDCLLPDIHYCYQYLSWAIQETRKPPRICKGDGQYVCNSLEVSIPAA